MGEYMYHNEAVVERAAQLVKMEHIKRKERDAAVLVEELRADAAKASVTAMQARVRGRMARKN